jgi:hypothetical protein
MQWPEKQPTPREPEQDTPRRLSEDFRKHTVDKIVAGGDSEKKYPARQCRMCEEHKKQSETRYTCKSCIVLLHKLSCFEKYHSVRQY